jgi:hypothetical protein
VEVIMPIDLMTPPGPLQMRPFWQQPYSPFKPRLQYVPEEQPPSLSGQHVSNTLMHSTTILQALRRTRNWRKGLAPDELQKVISSNKSYDCEEQVKNREVHDWQKMMWSSKQRT